VDTFNAATGSSINEIPFSNPINALVANPNTNTVYATAGGNVVVISGTSQSIIATIHIGDSATNMTDDPVHNRVYVFGETGTQSTLSIIDCTTNTITSTVNGLGGYGLAVNPVTNLLYIIDTTQGPSFAIYDANTLANVGSFGFQQTLTAIAVNSTTNLVYVTTSSGDLYQLDPTRGYAITATVAVDAFPSMLAVNEVTNLIYVNGQNSPELTVVNPIPQILATVALGGLNQYVGTGSNSVTVTTNPIGLPTTITFDGNTVGVFDPGTYSVVATITDPHYSGSASGTLTISAIPIPTIAVQPISSTVVAGQSVSFSVGASSATPINYYEWFFNGNPIQASNSPTYTISNAQVSNSGTYYVEVDNSGGLATSNSATLTVNPEAVAPNITTQPQNQTVAAGAAAAFWVSTTGSPLPTYQWSFNGSPINGATGALLEIENTQTSNAGSYSVAVANAGGVVTSNAATLTVGPSSGGPSPTIVQQPSAQIVASGSTTVFTVVTGSSTQSSLAMARVATGSVNYQWFWNGYPIAGATDSIFVLEDAAPSNDGSYSCIVSNSAGDTFSAAANLSVVSTSNPGRLTNISCRASVGTGGGILIAGFVVGGTGTSGNQNLLIRGSGPALTSFNVSGVLPDPQLQLYQTNSVGTSMLLQTNNGWNGNPTITSTAQSVGAFIWNVATSHDAALVDALPEGGYTAQISGQSGDSGIALIEAYDATPAGGYTLASPRIINVSARAQVGTGGGILIAGFVIGGTTSKTVLIRGSGPALGSFGVTGALPDPSLQVYRSNSDGSSNLLASNLGWGGNTEIASAAESVGAFSWGSSATPDSALFLTLPPGAYTAQIAGASGDTGISLLEVYEVP
jgi:hypothetical protein